MNGGRASNSYRGKDLPEGLFVCGDHMATATLNGALESGVSAGREAAKIAAEAAKKVAA
jgi:predicted NAD/FAD-dependent oxidoreductase